jgi:phenylalanyl-tRNA synthetase beta subunit
MPSIEGDARETIIGEKLRDVMMGIGFSEVISYSFISADSADLLVERRGLSSPLFHS